MSKFNIIKNGSFYTLGEELSSSISHGVGALLAIAGTVVLIVFACFTGDVWKIVSSAVYGTSMIFLFLMSTLYHALVPVKAKGVFRIFDHTTIYLLIAGTYTPITLVTLRQAPWGWVIFGIVWAVAITGIVFNSINIKRFKVLSMVLYLVSGWCIVLAFLPFIQAVPFEAVLLLLLGGVFYTGGIFFYRQKLKKHYHSIWHWCVLAGAVAHYFCILLYIVLA